MRTMLVACALLIGLAVPMTIAQDADRGPYVAAARLGVTDLGESITFYERLGCRLVFGDAESPFAVLSGGEGAPSMVLTPASSPVTIDPSRCHVRINFLTADLDRKRAQLAETGVQFAGEKRSAVGRYIDFTDPSGHVHGLKQLDERPREGGIYNVGIVVDNMKEAERYYGAVLGFEVYSRDYYPPVIPMRDSTGGVPFILSETGRGTAPYQSGAAFAGLAIEVRDIEQEAARLRGLGVELLDDEPRLTANVLHVTIRDPFGNLHEIIEHINEPQEAEPSATTISDLAWLSGPWRLERTGQGGPEILEETWSPPTGDAMTGMFRWMRDGTVWLYELMSIEEKDGSLAFHLRHFGRGLRIWDSEFEKLTPFVYPLESAGNQRLVFENPDREQPRRVVYSRTGDTLTVELLGPDGTGMTFEFKRVEER